MKCPECVKEGTKSKVYSGAGFSTAMGSTAFWDEDGRRHIHDPNSTSWSYSCSNGHRWTEVERHKCPSCDF